MKFLAFKFSSIFVVIHKFSFYKFSLNFERVIESKKYGPNYHHLRCIRIECNTGWADLRYLLRGVHGICSVGKTNVGNALYTRLPVPVSSCIAIVIAAVNYYAPDHAKLFYFSFSQCFLVDKDWKLKIRKVLHFIVYFDVCEIVTTRAMMRFCTIEGHIFTAETVSYFFTSVIEIEGTSA